MALEVFAISASVTTKASLQGMCREIYNATHPRFHYERPLVLFVAHPRHPLELAQHHQSNGSELVVPLRSRALRHTQHLLPIGVHPRSSPSCVGRSLLWACFCRGCCER